MALFILVPTHQMSLRDMVSAWSVISWRKYRYVGEVTGQLAGINAWYIFIDVLNIKLLVFLVSTRGLYSNNSYRKPEIFSMFRRNILSIA